MKVIWSHRVWLLAAALVLVAAAAGLAYASIPGGGGNVIQGCYHKETGQLRIIDLDAGESCLQTEIGIQWNQSGPQGPQGSQGPQGPSTTYTYRSGYLYPGTEVAKAFCLPGEKVTGGGGIAHLGRGLSQSFPISDTGGGVAWGTNAIGWQVAAEDFSPVSAYVVCASQ